MIQLRENRTSSTPVAFFLHITSLPPNLHTYKVNSHLNLMIRPKQLQQGIRKYLFLRKDIRSHRMSSVTNTNKPMDTEPGGENTQYVPLPPPVIRMNKSEINANNHRYESQKIFTSPPEKNNDGIEASQFKASSENQQEGRRESENVADRYRDASGRVNLPTHRVMRPSDMKVNSENQQNGGQGNGESEDVADRYRDESGTVHLPTHRKMRAADIKAKGEEEEELREREKSGYGGGNDVGA